MAAAPKPNQPTEPVTPSAKPAHAVSAVARADAQARLAVLQDAAVWKRFDDYFATNWQAKELRTKLENAGCDWELLQEWAVWSFHPAAKDEARQKRERGKQFRQRTQAAILGYEARAEVGHMYSQYQPGEVEAVEVNEKRANEERSRLGKAKDAFNADRIGRTWNRQYLVLLKKYIGDKTHWADKKVLTAIVYLVAAGQCGVGEKFIRESRPREVIRKAMQTFEHDPLNSIFIAKGLPKVLKSPYHFFPKR